MDSEVCLNSVTYILHEVSVDELQVPLPHTQSLTAYTADSSHTKRFMGVEDPTTLRSPLDGIKRWYSSQDIYRSLMFPRPYGAPGYMGACRNPLASSSGLSDSVRNATMKSYLSEGLPPAVAVVGLRILNRSRSEVCLGGPEQVI